MLLGAEHGGALIIGLLLVFLKRLAAPVGVFMALIPPLPSVQTLECHAPWGPKGP